MHVQRPTPVQVAAPVFSPLALLVVNPDMTSFLFARIADRIGLDDA